MAAHSAVQKLDGMYRSYFGARFSLVFQVRRYIAAWQPWRGGFFIRKASGNPSVTKAMPRPMQLSVKILHGQSSLGNTTGKTGTVLTVENGKTLGTMSICDVCTKNKMKQTMETAPVARSKAAGAKSPMLSLTSKLWSLKGHQGHHRRRRRQHLQEAM